MNHFIIYCCCFALCFLSPLFMSAQSSNVMDRGELEWTLHKEKRCYEVTKKDGSPLTEGFYTAAMMDLFDAKPGRISFYINNRGQIHGKLIIKPEGEDIRSEDQVSNGCYHGESRMIQNGKVIVRAVFKKGLLLYEENYSPEAEGQLIAKSTWKYKNDKIHISIEKADGTKGEELKDKKTNIATYKEYDKTGRLQFLQIKSVKHLPNGRKKRSIRRYVNEKLEWEQEITRKSGKIVLEEEKYYANDGNLSKRTVFYPRDKTKSEPYSREILYWTDGKTKKKEHLSYYKEGKEFWTIRKYNEQGRQVDELTYDITRNLVTPDDKD